MAEPRTLPSSSPERTDRSATKSLKVCRAFSIFNDTSPCMHMEPFPAGADQMIGCRRGTGGHSGARQARAPCGTAVDSTGVLPGETFGRALIRNKWDAFL